MEENYDTRNAGQDYEVVPQREYATHEEFKEGQNNFWHYFNDFPDSMLYFNREKECFLRFQEQNPRLEKDITSKITKGWQSYLSSDDATDLHAAIDSESLFEAYKIMSKLVYKSDEGVNFTGERHGWDADYMADYLTR